MDADDEKSKRRDIRLAGEAMQAAKEAGTHSDWILKTRYLADEKHTHGLVCTHCGCVAPAESQAGLYQLGGHARKTPGVIHTFGVYACRCVRCERHMQGGDYMRDTRVIAAASSAITNASAKR
jgi:hypothetical protein